MREAVAAAVAWLPVSRCRSHTSLAVIMRNGTGAVRSRSQASFGAAK